MSSSLCQLDAAKNLTGGRGIPRHVQTFVRFCDDMVDDSFHVLRPFPDSKLPIRASAFAHDPLNVCHLILGAELIYFSRDKLEQFV